MFKQKKRHKINRKATGFYIAGQHYFRCIKTYNEKKEWFNLINEQEYIDKKLKFKPLAIKARGSRKSNVLLSSWDDINFSQYPHKRSWKYHTKNKKQWHSKRLIKEL